LDGKTLGSRLRGADAAERELECDPMAGRTWAPDLRRGDENREAADAKRRSRAAPAPGRRNNVQPTRPSVSSGCASET